MEKRFDTNALQAICFHDLTVNKIELDLDHTPNLILEVSPFDNDTNSYTNKPLILNQLVITSNSSLPITNFQDVEIYSFDYEIKEQLLHGKFIFLTGFGKPSYAFEFSCGEVIIKDEL